MYRIIVYRDAIEDEQNPTSMKVNKSPAVNHKFLAYHLSSKIINTPQPLIYSPISIHNNSIKLYKNLLFSLSTQPQNFSTTFLIKG